MSNKKKVHKIFETVALVHIENKKLLQVLAKGKGAFYMPGGKHDKGESDFSALIREVQEELGVELLPDTIEYYGTFQDQAYGKEDGIHVKIICYTAKFNGELKASTEIMEIRFFTHGEYHAMNETAPAGRLIFADLKDKGLIE